MNVLLGFRRDSRDTPRRDARDTPATSHCSLATALIALLSLSACASGPPRPAALDTANDTCAHCRMAVSNRRFAAQIAAHGEEPVFFDDLGCLRDYLAADGRRVSQDAVVFVADHRTAEWVDARRAMFTRGSDLATPMGSGLMAHRDTSSLREDAEARGAVPVAAGEVLVAAGGGR